MEGWKELDSGIYIENVSSWFWINGIYESREFVRFVRVKDRKEYTLEIVLNKCIEPGS